MASTSNQTARQQLGKLVRRYLKEAAALRYPGTRWWYRGRDQAGERVWTHGESGGDGWYPRYDATANYTGWSWAWDFIEWLEHQPYDELPEGDIDALGDYEVGLVLWPTKPYPTKDQGYNIIR